MSHIHIPDGILPWWLVVAGWLITIALTALAVNRAAASDLSRRVPLLGAMAALMLVGMSTEIVPIAYHVNLTVAAGILLGPWLSIVAALVTVLMLSLVGHGGVTVAGLNTAVVAAEMVLGWAVFRSILRLLGQRRAGAAAAAATVIALATSTTLLVGVVAIGGSPAASRESGALDPQALRFENPLADGFATNVVIAPETDASSPTLSIARFATMVYLLGSIGWVLEALITAAIIGFVARVRPSLVLEGAGSQHPRAPLGDEGVHH